MGSCAIYGLQELRGPSTRRLLCAFALGSFSTAIAALSSALLLKSRLSAVLGGWEMACHLDGVEVEDGMFFSIAMEQWQPNGKSRICNLNIIIIIIIIGLHVDWFVFGGCKMLSNILESLW